MLLVLIVAAASLLIGLSKGGMGAALVILVTPLLTLVMTVPQAVGTSLPLLMIADAVALWMYWNTWDKRIIRLLLPTAVIGIIVGTTLLKTLPDLTLRHLLGVFTLLFVGYRVLSERLRSTHYQPQSWHGYAAGAATGLGSALANAGAPPFMVYMLLQDISPTTFVGTTTLFFAIVNGLKVPAQVLTGLFDLHDLLAVVWALPLIPLGVWLGRWMVKRLNRAAFERVTLFALVVAALVLLFYTPR